MIIVARNRFGAYSAFSAIGFGNSPPRPRPVRKRVAMSSGSEVTGIVARLNTPITSNEAMIAILRPYRSPSQPKNTDPNRIPNRPALKAVPSSAMLVMPHALTREGPAKATAPIS